ncbi:hypothetical protein HPB48_006626 [Haemaphysalis longicornis]|uniref:Uncharacterized protein n=1 Tax=Haemaphysalis longicornis TaxID=44386 RepID=A0A9J6GVT3_HAELO|nr:hypothetical protein HPB48_006626 [Haemaphysalis longicornis]
MARAAAAPLESTPTGRTPTQVLPAVDGTEPHPARQKESNMAAPRPDATPTPPPPTPQSIAVYSKEDDAAAGPWLIQSKRRRRRQRQTSLLLPARKTAGTVLFRPAGGTSFLSASRHAILRQLAAIAGVLEVRVNMQRNVVAADASSSECLARLLDSAQENPSAATCSRGIIYGVDVNISTADLLAGIETKVPLISARRAGQNSSRGLSG